MTPTKHDLELAWAPLEHVVRRNELIHACMDLHASGRLSELTAKLTAIDTLRFRIRESGMEDCSNHDVSYAVYRAVLGEPDWTRLHALILSLATKHDAVMREKISETARSQLSALQIKLTSEEAARLGLPIAKDHPPCAT